MQSITTTTDNGTDTVVPSTYSNNITTADTNDNVRTNRPNVSNADAKGNYGNGNGQDDDDDDDDDDPRWRPRPVTPTGTTATAPSATARGAVVGSSSSTIEIEELPPARPVKQRIGHVPSDASRGSKPKQSNLSLLSSTIAYATLERCLLGVNGGVLCDDAADGAVNYSKQCKAGHVIDILELRRLSSRGVPDEPPELSRGGRVRRGGGGDGEAGRYGRGDGNRSRGSREKYCDDDDCRYGNDNGNGNDNVNRNSNHSATASNRTTTQPPRQNSDNSLDDYSHSNSNSNSTRTSSYTASNNNAQSPGGNPHRSYRPLVWRVLLGYLPPQTELWNDVLARDRKLYQNLVDELFVSTCPSPHEVLDDRQETPRDGDDDGGGGGAGREAPITPGSATPQPSLPTPHSAGSARSTPGLLSARMQQEWIRGEDSIFNSPDGGDGDRDGDGNDANGNGNGNGNKRGKHPPLTRRLSPMCAMNVPRVRSTKLAAATASLPASVADAAGIVPTLAETRAGMPAGGTIANSLLLPEDGESDDDDDEQDEHDVSPTSLEDANDHRGDGQTVRNNVRIDHKNAGNGLDEGVELRPIHSPWHIDSSDEEENGDEDGQCGHDDSNDNDNHNATLPQSPSMDLDEEENMLLLDEIRKDVIRTHPDLRFFLEPKEDLGQKRYAALERILFVWAKLNKGVRYVQGMNEIVGTLYFVLAHDANEDWANEAEADTYFLFNSLMVEMRDVFVPDLDEADTGIHGRISNMISLLSLHDPEVRCHLDNVGIDPSFYSVRWLTTLLSREFLLPDTIRLWDSMFASTHKDNFLRYVSVTMVMVIRDQLLRGDFSTCLRILQAYPPTNLDRLLESSRALWIYESQITLACHKGGIGLGHALRSISPPPAIIMAYGLRGGIAPQIGEQVRQAGERGLAAARGAANGASHTVANAGRSFLGSALGFWRAGSAESREKKDGSNGGSFRRRANTAM